MKEVESEIWTEKYRPKNFDDIVGQLDIINQIPKNYFQINLINCYLNASKFKRFDIFNHTEIQYTLN